VIQTLAISTAELARRTWREIVADDVSEDAAVGLARRL
jgi:hypothetical protein